MPCEGAPAVSSACRRAPSASSCGLPVSHRHERAWFHLGVDRQWHRAEPATVGDAPYIVFVGLVKPHKNLMGLLRAFQV
jgi:hypothetical protein